MEGYPIERELTAGETFYIGADNIFYADGIESEPRNPCLIGSFVTDEDYGRGRVDRVWLLKQRPWFPEGFADYRVLVRFDDGQSRVVSSSMLSQATT